MRTSVTAAFQPGWQAALHSLASGAADQPAAAPGPAEAVPLGVPEHASPPETDASGPPDDSRVPESLSWGIMG